MIRIMKRILFLASLVLVVGCTCLAQPLDQLLPVDENCEAVVPEYTDDVTVVDNCPAGTVVTQSPLAGDTITVSQVCTVTATDAAGNSSFITFNLILDDQTPPVITPTGDLLTMEEIEVKEEELLTSK